MEALYVTLRSSGYSTRCEHSAQGSQKNSNGGSFLLQQGHWERGCRMERKEGHWRKRASGGSYSAAGATGKSPSQDRGREGQELGRGNRLERYLRINWFTEL